MKTDIKYALQGAFKVDIYSGEKLVKDGKWFSNFITQTGLTYPNYYAFADCFRFLSFGFSFHAGNVATLGQDTTGLYGDPLNSEYGTIGINGQGRQTGRYIGWQGYETGASCGTMLTETGPLLFRSWTIPTGGADVVMNFSQNNINLPQIFTIDEFMVSPSSGSDPTGRFAFSRVIKACEIPNGHKAVISYQLKINMANGERQSFGRVFNIANADVSTVENQKMMNDWANANGYYKQVNPSLRFVNSIGATYISRLGDAMEPCLKDLSNSTFYLSPDNSQFDVNINGGGQSDSGAAYLTDGLMTTVGGFDMSAPPGQISNLSNYYNTVQTNTDYQSDNSLASLINIRLGSSDSALLLPDIRNYANSVSTNYRNSVTITPQKYICYATPGYRLVDSTKSNFGQKAVFSTSVLRVPMSDALNDVSSRSRTIQRITTFAPVSSLGWNSRFGSLVYAYISNPTENFNAKKYVPIIDSLLSRTSGNSNENFPASNDTRLMSHYRNIDSIYLSDRGNGVCDARVSLSSSSNDNVIRFRNLQTIQGGYDENSLDFFQTNSNVSYLKFSGDINQRTGDVSKNIGNGSGWGMIYGVSSTVGNNSNRDLGIIDRYPDNPVAPNPTDDIFWPIEADGNKIGVNFSNVKFYHPLISQINQENIKFDSGQQFITDIHLIPRHRDGTSISDSNIDVIDNPVSFTGGKIIGKQMGYFLVGAACNFDPSGSNGGTQFNQDLSQIKTSFTDGTPCLVITDEPGYDDLNNYNNVAGSPTKYTKLILLTGKSNITNNNSYISITGFDSNYQNRGNLFSRGSTASPFVISGQQLYSFITSTESFIPSYTLAYIWKDSNNLYQASTNFNSIIETFKFRMPSGVPYHSENGRLLPYYGSASMSSDVYYPNAGGAYPGLSFDNGLQLYLNITWSSPCDSSEVEGCP